MASFTMCSDKKNNEVSVLMEDEQYEKAYKKCMEMLKADSNNIEAQLELGLMYYFGNGVEKNGVEAEKWFRLAAEQGYSEAQSALGVVLNRDKTRDEAIKWLRLAAGQGHSEAMCNLGEIYGLYNESQAQTNCEEAAKWYRLAAERGIAHAMYRLGDLYRKGKGVEKNYAEAEKWWLMVARKGSFTRQLRLAEAYETGENFRQDYTEAAKWYYILSLGEVWNERAKTALKELIKKHPHIDESGEYRERALKELKRIVEINCDIIHMGEIYDSMKKECETGGHQKCAKLSMRTDLQATRV